MQLHDLVHRLRAVHSREVSAEAAERAKHCLMDWTGVAVAGSREPAAQLMLEFVRSQGGRGASRVIGIADMLTSPNAAALANAMSGHVLDFDDVHLAMSGHPSATVVPAALAIAPAGAQSGASLIKAIIVGTEAACLLGTAMTESHYQAGWHSTATLGSFAAAATACALLDLPEQQWSHAFTLAICRSSGLQVMFGSDLKAYQVGKACADGVEAALLAALGLAGPQDILHGARGYFALYSGSAHEVRDAIDPKLAVESVIFKYHASCFGTHAAAEAVRTICERVESPAQTIRQLTVSVPPRFLEICNVAEPKTSAEAKFSLRYVCALIIGGKSTAETASFDPQVIADARIRDLASRIAIHEDPNLADASARVSVQLDGTGELTAAQAVADLSQPEPNTQRQAARLRKKFLGLVSPLLGHQRAEEILELIAALDAAPTVAAFTRALP